MSFIQDATIDGFRITNGLAGVGVAASIGVVVINNEIYGCQYVGVGLSGGPAPDYIGGLVIGNNIIHNNTMGYFVRYVSSDYPRIIRNNIFYNNTYAVYPMDTDLYTIVNNTIVYQTTDGFYFAMAVGSLVRNNIIAFNDGCGLNSYYDLEWVSHDYNDIFNNGIDYCHGFVPDTTEISADPLFVNPTIADYHLLPSSPCIDAGHPDTIYNDPDGTRNDMGAYGGPGAADWVITPLPVFLSGDVNGDGEITVSDVVYLINYLFKGGASPECPDPYISCSDVNCDGQVSVADVVYLINYLFKGGPAPGC
jgi:hypothetical protein